MKLDAAEQRHLDRVVTFSRIVLALLAFAQLLASAEVSWGRVQIVVLGSYLLVAVGLGVVKVLDRWRAVQLPLVADVAVLIFFLRFPSWTFAHWYLLAFVCFAVAIRDSFFWAAVIASAASFLEFWREVVVQDNWLSGPSWFVAIAPLVAGMGIGYLGAALRGRSLEHSLLRELHACLRVEQGLSESVRQLLDHLAQAFDCEEALLAFHDHELDRVFLWRARSGDTQRITPENLPPERSDAFLLDDLDASVCWNSFEGAGNGFGWNRRDNKPLREPPRVPGPSRRELNLRSLLSVAFAFGETPVGRLLLPNSRRRFSRADLRLLDRIADRLGPQLQNLFLLRHWRARAIEAERDRISRDLHDGVLQTLLSVEMQLEVLRRKLPRAPEQVAGELAALQHTLRNESAELRQTLTDLRPLRVESADLLDVMRSFAERFRSESGIALDLIIDTLDVQLPDSVCRELFQIYREALHNVKKHARATHVVVKVSRDEVRLRLVVDDNGQGFSFAGRFSSDELDRLRLGPISIKERTRNVGGVLTVESNPGYGARLTVEIPLS